MNESILNLLLFLALISFVGGMFSIHYKGLKKWWVWLFILGGFLSGFFIGLITRGIYVGLEIGAIFTFIIISGSLVRRHQKQLYGKIDRNK